MARYIELIIEFFKTGLFAVGGGLATIPFLRETGEKFGWFTEAELIDFIAVSESTPGPLGINMATYAGNSAGGILGGIIATLALVFPSVVIIVLITKFLKRFNDNKIAKGVFWAVRPAAAGLIAGALASLLSLTLVFNYNKINIPAAVLYIALTAACFASEYIPKIKKIKIHPVVFIAVGALCGVFWERLW